MKGAPPYKIETWFPADKTRADLITGALTPAQAGGEIGMERDRENLHISTFNRSFIDRLLNT
jgi:hypothetical protein